MSRPLRSVVVNTRLTPLEHRYLLRQARQAQRSPAGYLYLIIRRHLEEVSAVSGLPAVKQANKSGQDDKLKGE